jgi:two-component system secretion response regulator SsrB
MSNNGDNCVLLADRHHGLTEGVRGLLNSMFDAVVMVADANSLLQSVQGLKPALAVVDLSLVQGDNLQWLSRLRSRCPTMKLILISVHDEPSVRRAAMEAGADGFVLKRAIATELLPTIDAVLAGQRAAPGEAERLPGQE